MKKTLLVVQGIVLAELLACVVFNVVFFLINQCVIKPPEGLQDVGVENLWGIFLLNVTKCDTLPKWALEAVLTHPDLYTDDLINNTGNIIYQSIYIILHIAVSFLIMIILVGRKDVKYIQLSMTLAGFLILLCLMDITVLSIYLAHFTNNQDLWETTETTPIVAITLFYTRGGLFWIFNCAVVVLTFIVFFGKKKDNENFQKVLKKINNNESTKTYNEIRIPTLGEDMSEVSSMKTSFKEGRDYNPNLNPNHLVRRESSNPHGSSFPTGNVYLPQAPSMGSPTQYDGQPMGRVDEHFNAGYGGQPMEGFGRQPVGGYGNQQSGGYHSDGGFADPNNRYSMANNQFMARGSRQNMINNNYPPMNTGVDNPGYEQDTPYNPKMIAKMPVLPPDHQPAQHYYPEPRYIKSHQSFSSQQSSSRPIPPPRPRLSRESRPFSYLNPNNEETGNRTMKGMITKKRQNIIGGGIEDKEDDAPTTDAMTPPPDY